jgi:1-phosphatidylinositol-3-phosphate 5-kinase
MFDITKELDHSEVLLQAIKRKFDEANPDVIFVEKDISTKVTEMLKNQKKTVIANTAPKMLSMIARSTTTSICLYVNLLSKDVKLGVCGSFKVKYVNNPAGGNQWQRTSLLYLDSCQSHLGCSVVLEGPDPNELKRARHALQKCIDLARTLFHESEYLKFIKPDLGLNDHETDTLLAFEKDDFPAKISPHFSLNSEDLEMGIQTRVPYLFDKAIER